MEVSVTVKIGEPGVPNLSFSLPGQLSCDSRCLAFFFFNGAASTEIYTNFNPLSLHDALPISSRGRHTRFLNVTGVQTYAVFCLRSEERRRSEEHTSELQSHSEISYAVFC